MQRVALEPRDQRHRTPKVKKSNRGFFAATSIIVLFCLTMGFYFCSIQNLYYSHYQPFFDSLGYYDQMHAVIMTGQQEGWAAAIYHAFDSGTTVFLPYLVASLIWPFFEPSRNIGVWIQTVELGLLMVSVLYYFQRIKHINPLPALVLLVPFALTTCLYRNNGGMSDFRMDLSLYLTYSITCVWYLIAVRTHRKLHFFFVGMAIAATCLFRATAPVYLVLGLGPIALIEVIVAKQRRALIVGLVVATLTAVVGSLWFYLMNFEKLHYYYFVWNADANAKLSIAESSMHIKFAFKQIGETVLYWIICVNGILLWVNWKRGTGSLVATARLLIAQSFRETDWRLVWLAMAPLAMLVLRGAGLNQFVCLPAIIGVVLWLLNPIANRWSTLDSRTGMVSAVVASILCLALIGFEGWTNHRPGDYNSMNAHKQTIAAIVADAKQEGLRTANFGSTHVYYLNSSSLGAAMRFDIPNAKFHGRQVVVNDVRMIKNGLFSGVVADANWEELKGDGQAKLDRLLKVADSRMDYLIVPDEATIEFLETKIAFNIINQHQRYLRQHVFESGNWVAVGAPLVNGEHETVQLYRNVMRTRLAKRQQEELDTKLR